MANLGKIFLIIFLVSIFFYSFKAPADICPPTQNDVEGPYYLPDAPFRTNVAAPDEPGRRLMIKGTVLGTDCETPLKDALVEVWQTDAEGRYYYKKEGYRLRGQMKTDKNGSYAFNSIKPGRYRIGHGYRPAHIHIKVSHPGYRTLVTQLYFKDDPYLWPNDACGSGCRSNDPKRIIELQTKKNRPLEGTFIIILEKDGSI
jgi:protocatechuate 3,4-dioxygenase beta subunit